MPICVMTCRTLGRSERVTDWQVVHNSNDELAAKITVDRDLQWTVGGYSLYDRSTS